MSNGRTEKGVRDPGTPIKKSALFVDLHYTMAMPVRNMHRGQLVMQETEAVLGPIPMGWRKLARLTKREKIRLADILPPEQQAGLAFYGLLNTGIHHCRTEQGCEISRRLTTNPDLYDMPESLRLFFTWLFEEKFPFGRATLSIASNSDRQSAEALLEKIGMKKYFPSGNIFTPDRFNGVGKSPRFFEDAARAAGVDPKKAIHMGNSALHDLYAAFLMDVVWFRDSEETISRKMLRHRLGNEAMTRILTVRRIERARELIDARFVFAK